MPSRTDRIEQAARRHVEAGSHAGIEWLVRLDGHDWLRGSVGLADPLAGTPMPEKPIYRLYSMTKPVISAIALMLVEEGRLHLYDPVAAFLPDFARMQVIDDDGTLHPARRMMLVEHLLTHRSGLTYGFLAGCAAAARYRETDLGRTHPPLPEFIDRIASLPLAFEPGAQWRYSVGTDVMGRIIEIVEGKPLQQVVAERIVAPLGLEDTGFCVPPGKQDRLMPMFGNPDLDTLMVYPDGPQKLTPADVSSHYPVNDPAFARGGYGLYSTIEDYAKICELLKTGTDREGNVLLSRHMVRFMWTNRIPESQMPLAIGPLPLPGYGFSLAGRVMVDLARSVSMTGPGEYGWSGAASTFFWIDPAEDMIGVVMTQYLGSRLPLADDMRTAAYQALE
ncbi:MAG: beta-lactamase family protein [Nitratireductor sp.]|nr:beta-lactamase family protein [Nitratireductor sp.]